MKYFVTHLILIFFVVIAGASHELFAQETLVSDNPDKILKDAARDIIASSRFCALITVDDNGLPRARTMDAFAPDSNFVVWFGTKVGTRKIKQIESNPVTTLYYFHEESNGYVTLYGKAYIIQDKENKAKWWKEEWEEFYPENRKSYILIKFIPEWMEIYSSVLNIDADPNTWAPPRVDF